MSLPERKHHRLKNYDYSSNGEYFITICTYKKLHIFGVIEDGIMKYSPYGKIANEGIKKTNLLRNDKGIHITKWVVMPNHIHMLIEIVHDPLFDTNPQIEKFSNPTKQSIATIVRAYKSSVTKAIHQMLDESTYVSSEGGHGTPCPYTIWQNGYYDNIIRNDAMYEKIWRYIDSNPALWQEDCYNEL